MTILNFYVSDCGEIKPVSYDSSISVRDFMLNYLKNNTNYVTLDTSVYIFKSNGKILNSNRFIDKELGELIRQEGKIYFERKKDLCYSGGGIDMVDISKEKGLVRGNYSKEAPEWNYITRGLNVTGKCENNLCEAYDKEVVCKIGLGLFDLVGDSDQVKCPMCKKEIEPLTCIFCKCQYKIEGKKKINGETSPVSTPWKRVDYEYYDHNKNGIVRWIKLIIETKPL